MKDIDVIVFGGQSNMQGQSETLLPGSVVKNAFEYKFLTDTAVPLADPVGENILCDKKEGYPIEKDTKLQKWLNDHALGAACYGNSNLVPSFCRAYTEKSGNTALAVHCAKGSTTIAQWLKGTDGYEALITKARSAVRFIEKEYTVRKVFFVWLQGESDAIEGNGKEYYKQKLCELNESLRRDLSINRFCIIRVGRFTNDERDDEIINAQSEICRENSDFLMLTEEAVELNKISEFMNPYVGGHYSARGLERLGRLSGEALGKEV